MATTQFVGKDTTTSLNKECFTTDSLSYLKEIDKNLIIHRNASFRNIQFCTLSAKT